MPPERWVRIHRFLTKVPEISNELAELLRDSMNNLESLVFYGSRLWGGADELSDWDFLVIVRSEEAKGQMLSRIPAIEQRTPTFDAEVLSIQDFERFLQKDPIFLKLVERDGATILDFGLMGILRATRVTPKHIAVELLAAKESILRGIVAARKDMQDIACYWITRGARRTIVSALAVQGNFSGKMLEKEFAERFAGFKELREVCRKVRVGKRVSVSDGVVKRLGRKAIVEWEKTSAELRELGKTT